MAFQYVKFTASQVNPGSIYKTITYNGAGSIVSIGYQNTGYKAGFYASQMFVKNATSAFLEVVNTGGSTMDFAIWVVLSSATDAAISESDFTVDTESRPLDK